MGWNKKAWIERRKEKKPSQAAPAKATADVLLKSANNAATHARNLFVTYILLAVYIFLTVGATNDEQLLRDSTVAVPFLSNINLPGSRFYQFVPWMSLFVHVDLLLLFKLMADKLHSLNAELEKLEPGEADDLRLQLSGLPFVHWLAGRRNDSFSHFITGLVVWSSLLVLPLLTLLALQIGFLPYHSMFTTHAHQAVLVLDALALLWFWPRLAAGMTRQTWRWWLPFGAGRPATCRGFCRTASVVLLVGSVWFGGFVLVLPGERLEDDGFLVHWLLDGVTPSVRFVLDDEPFIIFSPSIQEIQQAKNLSWYSKRRVETELLSDNRFARWIQPHLPLFHRNLDLHEKLLVANDPDLETLAELQKPDIKPGHRQALLVKVKGLDLKNRDLRFANLSKTKLWRADLRGARLQNADLSEAQLQGIQWGRHAQLQGANLQEAQLQGAILEAVELQGAELWRVQFQGANLQQARLQGAQLLQAHLQGADLWRAQMQGADLEKAELQGAFLREAQLQAAKLWRAQMQGADADEARLQGADLTAVGLQGATLQSAQLQGVVLRAALVGSTSFKLADFRLNDFRKLINSPLFNKQYLEYWEENFGNFLNDETEIKRWEYQLRSRVGQATEWPTEAIASPCLADSSHSAPFQRCQTPNPDYFNALTDFLGNLACHADPATEGQDFIARSLAIRTTNSAEWLGEGVTAQRKLAQRLLQEDCAGKAGLDENLRDKLRELAETPEAQPPAATLHPIQPGGKK